MLDFLHTACRLSYASYTTRVSSLKTKIENRFPWLAILASGIVLLAWVVFNGIVSRGKDGESISITALEAHADAVGGGGGGMEDCCYSTGYCGDATGNCNGSSESGGAYGGGGGGDGGSGDCC